MTTDTALALLAEAKEDCEELLERMKSEGWHRPERIGHQEQLIKRITALLDSGIKDAGDDVVEPERIKYVRVEVECGNLSDYKDFIDYIDALKSVYKRARQEKKTVIDVYEGNLREADKRLIFWQERAEKAEAEREQLAEKVKYYESITTGAEHKAIDAAIDSARNK